MKPSILFSLLALALMGLVVYSGLTKRPTPVAVTPTYPPGREPMTLPQDYRDRLVLYAQVDRVDGVLRKIYISPAALDAVRAGQDLPERTQIVIEAYDAARAADGLLLRDAQGHLVPGTPQAQIHMAELRSEWQIEDLAASAHVGQWNFGAFDATSDASIRDGLNECFSCHQGAQSTGFLFTRRQLVAYAQSGAEQYAYCGQPVRVPCAR